VYACEGLGSSSLRFVHVDRQNQAAATLKEKEEKCLCVSVCVFVLLKATEHDMAYFTLGFN